MAGWPFTKTSRFLDPQELRRTSRFSEAAFPMMRVGRRWGRLTLRNTRLGGSESNARRGGNWAGIRADSGNSRSEPAGMQISNADGELFAVTRRCRHLYADLANGGVDAGVWSARGMAPSTTSRRVGWCEGLGVFGRDPQVWAPPTRP